MDKVYSGYELEVNKNVEDIAYNGRMLKIEGNSKQEVIEAVEGKSVTGEIIRATDIQNKNGRVIIEGNSKQEEIEEVKGKEVTGEFIIVNDVESLGGRIEVLGNKKQDVRQGYNKWKTHDTYSTYGLTFTKNPDGSFNLTGTATATASFGVSVPIKDFEFDVKYTLYTNQNIALRRQIAFYNGNTWVSTPINQIVTNTSKITTSTFSSVTATRYLCIIDFTEGTTYNLKNVKIMLLKGEYTEDTLPDYEQYGASPSPDYPSEVEVCGDNVNILPFPYFQTENKTLNGITWTINSDGSIKVSGTSTGTSFIDLYNNGTQKITEPNKKYTFALIKQDGNFDFSLHYYHYVDGWGNIITGTNIKSFTPYDNGSTGDLFRILVEGSGKTVDETIYPVLVKGENVNGYSPYGQGSINEVVCNKNLFNLGQDSYTNIGLEMTLNKSNLTINGTSATGNAFKTKGNITGLVYLGKFKAGTYIASCKVVSGSYSASTWTKYFIDGAKQSLGDFGRGANTMVVTLKEDTDVYFQMWCAAQTTFNNYSLDIQLEQGTTATEIIEHQSQAFTIPTQEPMFEGDYFNIYSKYEIHKWGKYIFTGNESFSRMSDSTDIHSRFTFPLQTAKNGSKMYCNMLPQVSQYITLDDDDEAIQLRDISNDNMISIIILNSRLSAATADGFKAYLKSLYDAGKPMYIWYELATKKGIALTDEQFEILSEMYDTEIYIPETNVYSVDKVSPINKLKYNYVLPSPSIDIPSDNKSVGDNVNLFNKSNEMVSKVYNDKTNTFQPNGAWNTSDYIETLPNNKYILSFGSFDSGMQYYYWCFDENKNGITGIGGTGITNTQVQIKIKDDSNIKYLIFGYRADKNATNIKLEEGTRAAGYSEYGQGSISEIVCNKNLFTTKRTTDGTAQGITRKYENEKIILNGTCTGAGWTLRVNLGLFKAGTYYVKKSSHSGVGGNKSYALYVDDINNVRYVNFLNNENTSTVKMILEKDVELLFGIWSNAGVVFENTEILMSISKETMTDYIKHEEQVFTIPTQQPMRAIGNYKDIFVKLGNIWYEKHNIARKVFDGITNKFTGKHGSIQTVTNGFFPFHLEGKIKGSNGSNIYGKCNYLKYTTQTGATAAVKETCLWWEDSPQTNYASLPFLTTNEANLWLQLLNEQGNPLYIDYVLATPTYIKCTEEQSEILNKLHNITVYVPETNVYSENEVSPNATLKYDYVLPSPSPEIPSEIESSGDNVNLFDGELEGGGYNTSTGEKVSYANNVRNVNPIPVEPNTEYVISNNGVGIAMNVIQYTSDMTYVYGKTVGSTEVLVTGSNTRFINIFRSNSTADKIKVEKGSIRTPYSLPEQGCINEVVCNKNRLDVSQIGSIAYSNGIRNDENLEYSIHSSVDNRNWTYDSSNHFVDLKAGTYTLTVFFETKISKSGSGLSIYTSTGKQLKFLTVYDVDKATTTFTIEEDTNIGIFFKIYDGKARLQLEEGVSTEYVEHQSQTFMIPTQQPFRSINDIKDIFIKINNKWYERHYITRKVFDGTETLNKLDDTMIYSFTVNDIKRLSENTQPYMKSNYYKVVLNKPEYDVGDLPQGVKDSNIYFVTDFLTVDDFKNWLTQQYSAGVPIYVDYAMATPIDIECTAEQEIILEKMQNIKLYDGMNYIYSLDDVEALLTFEYYYKMKDYDFYLSADGYLNIPSLGIRYLVDLNESSIPNMPEAVESAVRVAGRDGDVVLNTTYEPIPFNIVCYTEDNLTAMEKTEQETKINSFLNSIKNRTKRFAIERNTKFYEVKYNGALTTINFPKFLKFSIPFKSSDSYGKDIVENIMVGNEKVNSNTIKEVGALITIKGPAISPIIALNDYSIEYSTDIIDGARIEIDTNKSTVTHINSDEVKTNVMKYYNHQFPKIENGENELKILSGIDDNNRVNIKWNDLKL